MTRDLVKKAGIYGIAAAVTRGLSVLLLPVYTRFLSPAEYGLLDLLDLTASLAGLLLGAKLGQTLFYFYFQANEKDRRQVVSTAFWGALAMGAASLLLFWPLAPQISHMIIGDSSHWRQVQLAATAFSMSIATDVGYCYMRVRERASSYVRAALVTVGVQAALNLTLLVGFGMGATGILVSGVISSVGLLVYMSWYVLFEGTGLRPDLRLLGRMMRYVAPLSVSGFAVFFIHFGDRLFLRPRISLAELGVYALAYKLAFLIPFVHQPFHMHWTSQVARLMKEPEGERLHARSTSYLAMGLGTVAMLIALFSEPAVRIFAGPAFAEAGLWLPWIGFAYLIRAIGAHLLTVFIAEGKPHQEARVNTIGAVTCLFLYAIAIPPYGVWGAILATTAAFSVILVYGYVQAQRVRRVRFEVGRLANLTAVGALVLAARHLIHVQGLAAELALGLALTLGFAALLWLRCLEPAERKRCVDLCKNLTGHTGAWRGGPAIPPNGETIARG